MLDLRLRWCRWLDVRSRWCSWLGIWDRMELDDLRFHHAAQNGTQFKTWELLISRIFHLIFSDLSWPWAAQTAESKTTNQIRSDQSLSRVRLFVTPWIEARQSSLSITNSRSSLRLTSIESVMPSSHLILCRPLLLLPPIPPSIRVFSDESTLGMRWPKYWSFSFSIIPSKEIPGLIFRMDWSDLLAVQGTLKSLLLANLHLLSFFVSLAGSVLILPIFSKDQLFASLMFFIVFLISVLLISYPPSPPPLVRYSFSLALMLLSRILLCLQLIMMCLWPNFFEFILFGFAQVALICRFMFLTNLKGFGYYFFK